MESTSAILLRKIKLTDTSLILSWFTSGYGRIKTVAKGARQPKSRFAGLLDSFFECQIGFARSRKSDLHVLREVELTNPHEGLRLDFGRVALVAYFIELIELCTEVEHPAPELFLLLQRAFGYLNANMATQRALIHFEGELARLLGIQHPDVSAAVAICRAYHRLPSVRADLLKQMPAR